MMYDGTSYQGWQRQQNTEKTIQGILEHCISQETGRETEIDGSGRTDGGVHAKGQTASVILPGKVDEQSFCIALNKRLPEDIRVIKAELMKNGFHARMHAKGKRYEYFIDTREKADVFQRRYSFHFPQKLDIQEMKRAAEVLKGTHDFTGYTDKKDETSKVRTIYDIIIEKQGHIIRIEYYGTGFLYHMVRILTGTLLQVGTRQKKWTDAGLVLKTNKREDAGFLAPASGLFLKEVDY